MGTLLSSLRDDVIAYIGEVEGTSVQTYSEGRVDAALKHIFKNLHQKIWWPQYMQWFTLALDGTLGITTDATFGADGYVQHPKDIRVIIPDGRNKSIPLLPKGANPFNLSGTTPKYWESLPASSEYYASRRFQIWPKTSTGNVIVHARVRPAVITSSTQNELDDNLLIFGAAWMILEQEDINPNSAALAERMFTETYADIMKTLSNQPIENPVKGAAVENYLADWSVF